MMVAAYWTQRDEDFHRHVSREETCLDFCLTVGFIKKTALRKARVGTAV